MKKFLFIMLFPSLVWAKLDDGAMRYTIQVTSEDSYSKATSKMGTYSKFGYPHIFEKEIECKECVNNIKKMYRLYIGVYKSLDEAKNSLQKLKKENPKIFKDSIIQVLVN